MPPSPASNAEILFQSLFAPGADPFALLEDLATQKADENGWREFKEAAWYDATQPNDKAEAGRREEKLKAIWSESLSAFGNSGGGVLIWGISAPQREAKSTALAQNAEVLANRLRGLLINAVEPPVLGVEVRAVTRPNSKSGFVVCYVPPSAIGPHCGVWALGGYYVRGQDSNVRARPEILRRLFYPQTGPRLVPVVRLTVERGDNRCIHTAMGVNIRNDGSGSAKGSFIDFKAIGVGLFRRHPNGNLWKGRYHFDDSGLECTAPIHPGENVLFLSNLTAHGAPESPDPLNKAIECTFWIYSENAEPLRAEVRFEPDEITAAYEQKRPIDRDGTFVPFRR